MQSFEYSFEIDETAPRAQQPEKIRLKLKDHQLACLAKAVTMEKEGCIHYNIPANTHLQYYNPNPYERFHHNVNIKDNIKVNTNIGILGDIVGYGKTLTALSIIAASDVNSIHIKETMAVSYCNTKNYSYLSYETNNNVILKNNNIIKSTLIIVPRGPVYVQWLKALQNDTKLKYLAIENLNYIKKNLPEYKNNNHQEIIDYFSQYDVVLIKNTTLEVLISYYMPNQEIDYLTKISFIKRWKRIMIDEAHDICNKIPLMYFEFIWLISGTYQNIMNCMRSYNNILYNIKDAINYDTINMMLVKGNKEFVRNSFKIPVPVEKYYLCKMNAHINVVKNFINNVVLEKLNANDVAGAIRDLGGKSETEDSLIELVCKELKKDILNKEREKNYVASLDIPADSKAIRLHNIENEININKMKLQDLTTRVSELNKKMCSICMYDMERPIVLECTHSYCATCIVKWLDKNMNCPECRHKISPDKMIAVVSEKNEIVENVQEKQLNKEDTLLKIIKDNPDGKYLVFSKYDSGFVKIMEILQTNDISCAELKGNTQHMVKVLDKFQSGEIKVILLNTNFAGSGIDISFATDVIIFHAMGLQKYQAIGRAQRVGRKDTLNIHYLCYEHEMNNEKSI